MELCTPVTPPLLISKQIYQSKAAATKDEHAADMCMSRCSTNVCSKMPTLESMPSLSDIGIGQVVSAPFDESSIFDMMSPFEKLMTPSHDIPQIEDAGDLDINPLENLIPLDVMGSLANGQMNVGGQAWKEKMEESKPKLPIRWNMQNLSNQDVEEVQESSLMKTVKNHYEEQYRSVGCTFAVTRLKADQGTDESGAAQTHGLTSPRCNDGMSAMYQLEASTCHALKKDEVETQVSWNLMKENFEMHDMDMIDDNRIHTKPQERAQVDDVPTFESMPLRTDISQGESFLFEVFDMMMPLKESMPLSVDIPFFENPSDLDMTTPLKMANPLDMMKPLTKRRFNSRTTVKTAQIEESKPHLQKRLFMKQFGKRNMDEVEEISAQKVVQDSCEEHGRPVEFSFFNVLRLKGETSADESEASEMHDLSSLSCNAIMSPLDELEAAICHNGVKKDQEETHAKCCLMEENLKLHARAAAVDVEIGTNPQKHMLALESIPLLSDIRPGESPLPDTLDSIMQLKKMTPINADIHFFENPGVLDMLTPLEMSRPLDMTEPLTDKQMNLRRRSKREQIEVSKPNSERPLLEEDLSKNVEKVKESTTSIGFVEDTLKLHDTVTTVDDKMHTQPQKHLQFGEVQQRPQKAPAVSSDQKIATKKGLPDMEWDTMAGAPGQALRRKRSSAAKM